MAKPIEYKQRDNELDLASTINLLFTQKRETLSDPILRFDITPNAAAFNLELLRNCNFNLTTLCNSESRNVTRYGSEFKEISKLRLLLGMHHQSKKLEKQLTDGVHFELECISSVIQRQDIEEAAKRGNHEYAKIKNRNLYFLPVLLYYFGDT